MRPTTKISAQNIFMMTGKFMKVAESQSPGMMPTFVKHASVMTTEVEKGCPLSDRITEQTNIVSAHRKK